jgi:hypothetical protein
MQHFTTPTLKGTRFDGHTLPLEIAQDLVAYEKLIVDLAKHLYLEEHTSRKRVPKGFGNDFQLHLEKLEEGSTKPVLAIVTAASMTVGGTADYFEQARDIAAECIAASPEQLPAKFPKHLLKHFNHFGKSLEYGEELIFNEGAANSASLTPEKRKMLVLSASGRYEKDIQLKGYVDAPNFDKGYFILRQDDAQDIECPMSHEFHELIRRFVGLPRHIVSIEGVGAYDSWESLKQIINVESIEFQPNAELSQKLEFLLEHDDGWYGEGSIGFTDASLESISAKLIEEFPTDIEFPALVPTPEGNILLEWGGPSHLSVDINLQANLAELHAYSSDNADIELDITLDDKGWTELYQKMREVLS